MRSPRGFLWRQALLEVALQKVDARKMGSSQKSRLWELHFRVRARLGYEHEWEWWGQDGLSSGCWGTVHVGPGGIEGWQGRTLKCANEPGPSWHEGKELGG